MHSLPVARTAELIRDESHVPVSTGRVSYLGQKTSLLLADTVMLTEQAATASTVAHVDKTGLRRG